MEKKVSATRHITIGFIRNFLPDKIMPRRVNITITKVNKIGNDDFCFNLVSYKQDSGSFLMDFSSFKSSSSVQFKLDTLAEEYGNTYFERSVSDGNYFLEPIFEEQDNRWIISVYIPLQDDMGSMFPVIFFFVLSQECYQNYNSTSEKIVRLIQRFSNWLFNFDDLNKENLSKLSSQLQEIIVNDTEPPYLEMKEILKMQKQNKLEGDIVLIVLKEHRNGGISLYRLADYLRENKQTLSEITADLANRGYLRTIKVKDTIIVDSLWII